MARAAPVTESELVGRLRASANALLGEQHDNVDHHRLQARLVAAIGGKRAVVFEMGDRDRQAELDAAGRELDAIARALGWSKSGWPPFATYAPIFAAANAAGMPLVAGNLPRAGAKAIAKGGVVEGPAAAWLARQTPLDEAQRAALGEELRASHCGHLPEEMVAGMAAAQVARDACLADAMVAAGSAVLIAGAGHARVDRGVPLQLAARGRTCVSLAFVEVAEGRTRPEEYAARWGAATLPFDVVWFTPRASDEDPCRAFGGKK